VATLGLGNVVETTPRLAFRIEATFILHLCQVDTMRAQRILATNGRYKKAIEAHWARPGLRTVLLR